MSTMTICRIYREQNIIYTTKACFYIWISLKGRYLRCNACRDGTHLLNKPVPNPPPPPPPPNEYKPSWNPLRSCISPGLLIGSLQYVDKAPNIINRAKSELLDAEQNSWNKWRHLPGVISLAKQKCRQCIYFENSEVLFWNSGKIQIAFIFHQSK